MSENVEKAKRKLLWMNVPFDEIFKLKNLAFFHLIKKCQPDRITNWISLVQLNDNILTTTIEIEFF